MMTVKKYLLDRLRSLRSTGSEIANPFKLLGKLKAKQWRYFLVSQEIPKGSKHSLTLFSSLDCWPGHGIRSIFIPLRLVIQI